jgi:hypothetical protein
MEDSSESIYQSFQDTLAEVSYSDDTKRSIICDDTKPVVNLDRLALSKKGLCGAQTVASFDAFYIDKADNQYLIEFKDQPSKNIKSNEIHKKIFGSTALLLITCQKDLSVNAFTANTTLFVIFRDDENEASYLQIPSAMKKWMEDNPAKSGEPLLFNLRSEYKSTFKEIHTIPESIFKKSYLPIIFQ